MKLFRSFITNLQGATAIEYGLIAALIAVAAIGAMGTVGGGVKAAFNKAGAELSNAADDTPSDGGGEGDEGDETVTP